MIALSKDKKPEPTYNSFQNACFVFKQLWSWDKPILFYILANIPILVLLPLCTIYLPKIIIAEIENTTTALHMIQAIGIISSLILVLSMAQQFINAKMDLHTTKVMLSCNKLIATKAMNIYYEAIDRPSTQVLIKKSYDLMQRGIQTLPSTFGTLLANIAGFVAYVGILSTISPLIVILIVMSTFISYFTNTAVNKWVFNNRERWFKLDLKIAYLTYKSSAFDVAKDIRLYKMNQWFHDAFHKFMNRRIKWTFKMQGFYFLASAVESLLVLLRDGAVYFYLMYLVFNGDISVSDFVLYFGVISGFSTWCMSIIRDFTVINELNYAISDLRTYLELPELTDKNEGLEHPVAHSDDYSIELKDVTYCYESESNPTLKNLNLSIKSGEKIAIVGANGAGKTTFVKLICGLYTPTSGEIKIGGHSIGNYSKESLYKLFSPVFQDIRLLPISILKNITLCEEDEVDRTRLDYCLKLSGFDEVIAKLPDGLDTLLVRDMDEKAIQLSGGEEQKLMLTRALYKSAPIMILDEPTAALDPIAENNMYLKYNELTESKTSIFISHRLASTRFCDRIILIEHGQIIEIGSHDELLSAGKKYAEMFETQAQYYQDNEEGDLDESISC